MSDKQRPVVYGPDEKPDFDEWYNYDAVEIHDDYLETVSTNPDEGDTLENWPFLSAWAFQADAAQILLDYQAGRLRYVEE